MVGAFCLVHATLAALASVVEAPDLVLHTRARFRLAPIRAVAEDVRLLLPLPVLSIF